MNRIIFFALLVSVLFSCRKRNDQFGFAGAWTIQKVEQIKYVGDQKTLDSTIKNDSLGWFSFIKNNVEGYDIARYEINFTSFSGLSSNDDAHWEIDQHEGDRLIINSKIYTRSRFIGGEQWTWISMTDNGVNYNRETIYVKHQ